MVMTKEVKRNSAMDNLRGVLILLVILGHTLSRLMRAYSARGEDVTLLYWMFKFIYSFHMPTFFAISGFFFISQSENSGAVIIQKIKKLLIKFALPYIIYSIIFWIFKYIFRNFTLPQVTIADLLMIPIKPIDIMWYLYCIFFLLVYVNIIDTFCKNKEVLFCILFTIAVLYSRNIIWAGLNYPLQYMVYFYLGCIIRKICDGKKHINTIIGATLILYIVTWMLEMFEIGSYTRFYKVVSACCASMCLILFFTKYMVQEIPLINHMGRITMPIYLIHILFTGGVCTVMLNITANRIVQVIVGFMIPWLVCFGGYEYVIKRIKVFDFIFYPDKYIEVDANKGERKG